MSQVNNDKKETNAPEKWQKVFTWMLLANVVYILIFFLITKTFS